MSVRTCQYHPVAYIFYLIPSRQDLFEYSCYCVMPPHKPSWELAMPPDQPIWRNHAGQTCRGLFFSTLVALVDPGKQTHTRLCIFKFIFITFIHESQYTICLTLVTIRHELTKMRRTHLATQKNPTVSYIDLMVLERERDISIYIFLPLGRRDPPSTRHGLESTPCQRGFPGGMPVLFRRGGHCTVSWDPSCLPFRFLGPGGIIPSQGFLAIIII